MRFRSLINYWQWQNNLDATHQEDCTVSHSGDCSEKVIVSTPGNFWEVQVGQSVKLIAGKTYTWKFWAKASTATEFSLQAYMNHSPWTQQGLFRTVGIGTDWQEYTYTFTPVTTDENSVVIPQIQAPSFSWGDLISFERSRDRAFAV